MKIIKFLCFLLMLIGSEKCFSNSTADSLKSVVIGDEEAPNKIDACIDLAMLYYQDYPDSALFFVTQAYELNKHCDHPGGLSQTCGWLGYLYMMKGHYEKSVQYTLEGLEPTERVKDTLALGNSYGNLALCYEKMGNFGLVRKYRNISLEFSKSIKDTFGIVVSYCQLSGLMIDQAKTDSALVMYDKCFAMFRDSTDARLGTAYNNVAGIYETQGDNENALKYYRIANVADFKRNHKTSLATGYNNMAKIFENLSVPDSVIHYGKLALQLAKSVKADGYYSLFAANLAVSYMALGHLDSAKLLLDTAEFIMNKYRILDFLPSMLNKKAQWYQLQGDYVNSEQQILKALNYPSDMEITTELYKRYSTVLKKMGNYEKAFDIYNQYIILSDSLSNQHTKKLMIHQQTGYEFNRARIVNENRQMEEQITREAEVNQRNMIQYSIILTIMALLIVFILLMGQINLSEKWAEGILFFAFVLLFEFILVLTDDYVETLSGSAPGVKLFINSVFALLIFPVHAFFETRVKSKLFKTDKK